MGNLLLYQMMELKVYLAELICAYDYKEISKSFYKNQAALLVAEIKTAGKKLQGVK